jgi:beta-1,4-mannosyltransferase
MHYSDGPSMIELQFFPDYIGDNEYIELFYKALEPYGVRARDGLVMWDKFLEERAGKLDIIQIQWCPERLWRGEEAPRLSHLRRVARLWKNLRLARRLGMRVIWTIHDFVHHDHIGSGFVDRCGYRVLARGADLCICHSERIRGDVIRHYWARPEKTVVMPIGNYDGVYAPPQLRSETLHELGLPETRRTLLCFGTVRPYKGLELAVEALRSLGDDYQLIIAGPPYNIAYGEELRRSVDGMANVRLILKHVEKQTLANLIHAADCVLMPYRRITGSGALLTCLTLGRGVVASDLPFFRDILSESPEAGVLATPGDARQLASAIETFFEVPIESRHAAARRIADQYAWSVTTHQVVEWIKRTFPEKVEMASCAQTNA